MKKLVAAVMVILVMAASLAAATPPTAALHMPQASLSLDARGHVLTAGPHIDPHPVYHAFKNGQWVDMPADTAQPAAGKLQAAQIVAPPLPTDYGATIDGSSAKLFAGAGMDDVNQNQADDCYLLAVWDSLLRQNPNYARAILTRDAAGHNLLTFRRNGAVTVQTDSLISAGTWAHPSPTTGAIDGCIVEKSYCYFRSGADTVASIDYGFPGTVMTDVGIPNVTVSPTGAGAPAAIVATVGGGNVCAACSKTTIPAGIAIVANHCYSVSAADNAGITLRNPWGVDGQGAPLNPPGSLIVLSWADFGRAFTTVSCGTGYAQVTLATSAQAGDANGDGVCDFADFTILSNHFGTVTSLGAQVGDFNGDGRVDFADFVILSNNFSSRAGAIPANFQPLPALSLDGNFPVAIAPGAVLKVQWTSNGDAVKVSDVLWKNSNVLPANGSFMTGVIAGDVWTFEATRAADGAKIAKVVPVK